MKWILPFLLLAACACAQSPDCSFTASFTSATASVAQPNKATSTGGTPCVYWTFTYWTNGATGVSIKLEGTNDSSGSPGGSYTALTAIQGTSNPATGTNQGGAVLCCDSYPWVRLNPTIFTGSSQTMIARAYGWRTPPGGSVTSGGGTQNVNLIQVGGSAIALGQTTMSASIPVAIASDQSSVPVTVSSFPALQNVNVSEIGGSSYALGQAAMASSAPVVISSNQSSIPVTPAANSSVNLTEIAGAAYALGQTTKAASAPVTLASDQGSLPISPGASSCAKTFVNLSGSGNTQLVAGVSLQKIYICDLEFSTATPENLKLTEGTGVNCGTGTADASALMLNIVAWSLTPGNGVATATAGDALCANQSASQAAAVTLWYLQQ